MLTILGGVRYAPNAIPWLVGLTITAAYWFTASTSFANPAVALARGFTTTFAGIAINHVPAFIAAEMIGAHSVGSWGRFSFVLKWPEQKAGERSP